jgi:opacity protein-like surface antigen
LASTGSNQAQILKTYPDGTKKIVPISALNFRDDGDAFGGPPQLSVYSNPAQPEKSRSPERLSVAPIGTIGTPTSLTAPAPPSPDSTTVSSTSTSAGDPMGGDTAPVDPLSGAATPNAPPLETISGKPAPISDATATTELGTYDDFFMNAAIGGAIQGQLTARRVSNGSNMQAYPYTYTSGVLSGAKVSAENFTFNPGFRFDVEFGYNIYDWLGVSAQTGIVYNGINQYNVTTTTANTSGSLPAGSYHFSADGDLVQVPVQLDAILRWPGAMAFKPFLGGGIGAIWQQLDVNNYYAGATDVQANYCRSAFQFGYNFQVGANYTVTPGVDFYGALKLLGAFTPRIGNYDFENSYNFALEVGIQSRF